MLFAFLEREIKRECLNRKRNGITLRCGGNLQTHAFIYNNNGTKFR